MGSLSGQRRVGRTQQQSVRRHNGHWDQWAQWAGCLAAAHRAAAAAAPMVANAIAFGCFPDVFKLDGQQQRLFRLSLRLQAPSLFFLFRRH